MADHREEFVVIIVLLASATAFFFSLFPGNQENPVKHKFWK